MAPPKDHYAVRIYRLYGDHVCVDVTLDGHLIERRTVSSHEEACRFLGEYWDAVVDSPARHMTPLRGPVIDL